MAAKFVFTSESVTEGHPDKVCDKISDSVLDAAKKLNPNYRVACETLVTEGHCVVTGEVSQPCID
ncbi:MAG TPA: S-adenosylmethionine synthetase N-terminal domain-containing protein, partial [Candidatus Glassbacteria bacterium]|nr:S-adenosylmethionine synthetase N-terminal domain-containing protein [Candidatus Glassbacteria bacterium]